MKNRYSHEYLRELKSKEINDLKKKFSDHIKPRKNGFLTRKLREKLLRISKHTESNRENYDNPYEIREHAKSAMRDFQLIIETLTDDRIKEIFKKDFLSDEEQKRKPEINSKDEIEFFQNLPSILNVFDSLFKLKTKIVKITYKDGKEEKSHEYVDVIDYDDSWKAILAEDILNTCLKFFIEHRYISTKAHQRLVDEIKDAINVEVSRGMNLKISERTKGHV